MGRWAQITFAINPLPAAPIAISLGPAALANLGCNLRVEVATASAFVNSQAAPVQRQSLQIWAHLDTGASQTTISPDIAQHLGLSQIGVGTMQTANGPASNPTYAIDLLFVGTTLASRPDLIVSSCTLPFTMANHLADPTNARNFGMLIGRDVMAAWHITWDGPSSSLFISE